MPIVINGSGTVTGISVGGIPDGVVDTDVLAANAVTAAKLGTDEASGLAKAWVNFNGTGAVAIRASYNVSSITDNGTGDYTVNFTTAMADANYVASFGAGSQAGGTGAYVTEQNDSVLRSTTQLKIYTTNNATTVADKAVVSVAIFR
jgi:hypothetical protein